MMSSRFLKASMSFLLTQLDNLQNRHSSTFTGISMRAIVLLCALFCGFSVKAQDVENEEQVKAFVDDMMAAEGNGYTCVWQLTGPGDVNGDNGVSAVDATVASGISAIGFTDVSTRPKMKISSFLGGISVDMLFKTTYYKSVAFPTSTSNSTGANCYFFRSQMTKPDATIQNYLTVTNDDVSDLYLQKTSVAVSNRSWSIAADGHLTLELTSNGYAVAMFGLDVEADKNGTCTGNVVLFNKLRIDFYHDSPKSSATAAFDTTPSPFVQSGSYAIDAKFSDDGSEVSIYNLYGTGLEYFGNVFHVAANGYSPLSISPIRVTLNANRTAQIATDHEVMIRPDYGFAIPDTKVYGERRLTFTAPGADFKYRGYIMTGENPLPDGIDEDASISDRSAIEYPLYNSLHNGELQPVAATWEAVAENVTATAKNPHWFRPQAATALQLTLGQHYLVPIKFTHNEKVTSDRFETRFDRIWSVQNPHKVHNVKAVIAIPAALADKFATAPDATLQVNQYGDNKNNCGETSPSRIIEVSGTLTAPGDVVRLYICRGTITDYDSDKLADTAKGHNYGSLLYDSTATESVDYASADAETDDLTKYQVDTNIRVKDIPADPDCTDNRYFTLYASYQTNGQTQYAVVATLDSDNPTTGITDIIADPTEPADNTNATENRGVTRYYNLQGQPIATPVPGQPYIKRTNNRATICR